MMPSIWREMSYQYKNALTFTGHSLGGGLASAAALETHRNIRSYYIPGEVLTNVQKNIAGWIRLTRPGTQIALPVPPGGKYKLHGINSVLSAMGL